MSVAASAPTTALESYDQPAEVKAILAASVGGHLAQLVRLESEFPVHEDSLWITPRTPQSESLLEGRRVLYVPYVRSRDLLGTLRTSRRVSAVLGRERFGLAVSTGAALGAGVLLAARLRRIHTVYIESVSRVSGPSLTGRLVDRLHIASELRTQHPSWRRGRWREQRSVLGSYESYPAEPRGAARTGAPRLFVTLGTIRPYRFDALVDAVLATGLASDSTVWQVGETQRTDLPGTVVGQTTQEEFDAHCTAADVVITHAGVGTIMRLLDGGHFPVVVPRRSARKEHVDDHQAQIAGLVADSSAGLVVEAPSLSRQDLVHASRYRTRVRH